MFVIKLLIIINIAFIAFSMFLFFIDYLMHNKVAKLPFPYVVAHDSLHAADMSPLLCVTQ